MKEQKQIAFIVPVIEIDTPDGDEIWICPHCRYVGTSEDFDCAGLVSEVYCNQCGRILAYP